MKSHAKGIALIVSYVIFLFLTGCATNIPVNVSSLDNSTPPQDKGIFTLLVSDNSDSNWYDTLHIVSLAEGRQGLQEYIVQATPLPGSSDVLFFNGSLPPGQYRLSQFTRKAGNALYYVNLQNNTQFQFEVKAGTISDLGRLIETKFSDNQILYVCAVDEPSSYKYVDTVYPELSQQLEKTHPNTIPGWNLVSNEKEKFRYLVTRMTARDFNSPTLMSDGSVLGGTRLGGVLVRTPDQKWKRLDTHTNHTVQSVAEIPGAGYFVGTEMLNLFLMDASGSIKPVKSDGLPYGKIIFSRYFEKNGLVLAILTKAGLGVYSTASVSAPNWKLVQLIPNTNNFFLANSPMLAASNDNTIFIGRDDSFFAFDLRTNNWSVQKTNFSILQLAARNDLIWARVSSFLSKKTYLSSNGGQTWEETNSRDSDSILLFTNASEAYSISEDQGGMVKYTPDGGKTFFNYDKPDLKNLPFKLSANAVYFMPDTDTILFTDSGRASLGTAVFSYKIKEKKLTLEHYLSLPMVIKYLQEKSGKGKTGT